MYICQNQWLEPLTSSSFFNIFSRLADSPLVLSETPRNSYVFPKPFPREVRVIHGSFKKHITKCTTETLKWDKLQIHDNWKHNSYNNKNKWGIINALKTWKNCQNGRKYYRKKCHRDCCCKKKKKKRQMQLKGSILLSPCPSEQLQGVVIEISILKWTIPSRPLKIISSHRWPLC